MQSKGFKKRAVFGAVAVAAALLAGAAQAVGVPGQGTWETTLKGRDIGGAKVAADSASAVFLYDKTLDVTWLRDANANGKMTWNDANKWADRLTVGAFSGWRLPTMIDTGAPGCDLSIAGGTDCGYNVQTKSGDPAKYEPGQTVYSEMAHLFYVALGNKAFCPPGDLICDPPQPGYGLSNTGNFQNMQSWPGHYWSGLEYATGPGHAWYFTTDYGLQGRNRKFQPGWVLAVRPGDVAVVPEPQTYVLLLLGLTALAVARRRPH